MLGLGLCEATWRAMQRSGMFLACVEVEDDVTDSFSDSSSMFSSHGHTLAMFCVGSRHFGRVVVKVRLVSRFVFSGSCGVDLSADSSFSRVSCLCRGFELIQDRTIGCTGARDSYVRSHGGGSWCVRQGTITVRFGSFCIKDSSC